MDDKECALCFKKWKTAKQVSKEHDGLSGMVCMRCYKKLCADKARR